MKICSTENTHILTNAALKLTLDEPAGVKKVAGYLNGVINDILDTSYYVREHCGVGTPELVDGISEYRIGDSFGSYLGSQFIVRGCIEPALTHEIYALGASRKDRDEIFDELRNSTE
ncbi:MAG: hypothetical protein KAJ91_01030 [Candidatus Aenigmarchaeota archaeon]|nr:hypothetical protein [Candidatus Aenigmarchaeota archaeon]MCK5333502.1 hypothetical protein [Candidatus Aenigmarchaeota archaeon]